MLDQTFLLQPPVARAAGAGHRSNRMDALTLAGEIRRAEAVAARHRRYAADVGTKMSPNEHVAELWRRSADQYEQLHCRLVAEALQRLDGPRPAKMLERSLALFGLTADDLRQIDRLHGSQSISHGDGVLTAGQH